MSTELTIGLVAIAVLIAVIFVLVAVNSVQVARRERRKASASTDGAESVFAPGSDAGTRPGSGATGGAGSDGGGDGP